MGNRLLYGRTTTLMPVLSSRSENILLIYVLEYICQTTQKTHMLSDKQVENLVVIPKFHLLEAGYYAGKQTKESSLPICRNIRLNTLFKLISLVFIGNMNDELSWPQKTFTPLNYLFHPGKLHKMNLLSFWKWPFFSLLQWFIFSLENPFYKREYDERKPGSTNPYWRPCLSGTHLTMCVSGLGNAAGSRDNSAFQALQFTSCLSTVIVRRQDETHRCVKKLKWNPTWPSRMRHYVWLSSDSWDNI